MGNPLAAARRLNVADLSTGHLTEQDNVTLEALSTFRQHGEPASPLMIASSGYGYYVSLLRDGDDLADALTRMREMGISETFSALVLQAKDAGCDGILFDRDAEAIEGLPTFEW